MHPFLTNYTRRHTAAVAEATGDPYFNNVVFLAHLDREMGDTTFIDVKGHTITGMNYINYDNGYPKFGIGCLYNNGGTYNEYLAVTDSVDWDLPGDFTLECWYFANAGAPTSNLIEIGSHIAIGINSSGVLTMILGGTTTTGSGPDDRGALPPTWKHMALVRSGSGTNNCKLYRNGIVVAQATYTTAVAPTTFYINESANSRFGGANWVGGTDEIRLTKGIARYTTDFTPPTTAFPDTLQFSPDPFFNNVTLLMHMDGTDGSTTFTDVKEHVITPSGNAQIDIAQSKFGGASTLFDGTGDYLSVTDSADWDLPGNFTVEMWLKGNSIASKGILSTGGTYYIVLRLDASGYVEVLMYNGAQTQTITGSTAVHSNGIWNHVALVRSSNIVSLYVNGSVEGTPISNNREVAPSDFRLGYGSSGTFNGWLDDIRITKGIARYTANFTPPTTAFPDTLQFSPDPFFNNVTLLMHCDGADTSTVFTDVKGHTVTRSGSAAIRTAQSKFGGASVWFGGSEYLTSADTADWDLLGDFTIECWAFRNNTSTIKSLVAGSPMSSNTFIAINNAVPYHNIGGSGKSGSTAINSLQWYHLAIVRTGSLIKFYINGINDATMDVTYATAISPTGLWLGGQTTWLHDGYLDDIRITKGIARYTANFTPPVLAFPNS
jgi:hypothetical protein